MKKLYAPSTIADIKQRHNFRLSKSLGQNFITDKNVIEKIVEGAGICEEDLVIEIGPGIGVLTAAAAQIASKVIAVEIDKKLIPVLSETLSDFDNVEVINKDILKTNVNSIITKSRDAHEFSGDVKIIGNLPYYITTAIIMKLLEEKTEAESITIMMQKEVADRIKAAPGNKTYGALSVAVQYYCETRQVISVPKEVFIPRPKVDSAVLHLSVRKEKPVILTDERIFFACIKSGFGQRRKTLLNSLTGVYGLSKEEVGNILFASGIDSMRRAETLSIEEFASLSNQVSKALEKSNRTDM